MRVTVPKSVLLEGEDKYSNKKYIFRKAQLVEQDLNYIIHLDPSKILPLRCEIEADKLRITGNNTYYKIGLIVGATRFNVDIPELEIGDFKEVEFDIQPVIDHNPFFNAYAVFEITDEEKSRLLDAFKERLRNKVFQYKHFNQFRSGINGELYCLGISFSHEDYRLIGYPNINRLLRDFFSLFEDEQCTLRSIDGIKIEEYYHR